MPRKKLPDTRVGQIHKIIIVDQQAGGYELYITANRHEDGTLGEVFLGIGKPGSTLQGMLDGWAIMLSLGLQYGVPLEKVINKFKRQSFSPSGKTNDENIPECSSLLDCVVRHLELLASEVR